MALLGVFGVEKEKDGGEGEAAAGEIDVEAGSVVRRRSE